jgi:myo-inositol-1(or 4)-monophosphatase
LSTHDPLIAATALEAVLRAGALQLARLHTEVGIRKKGAIDLVTEIDLAVEREARALIGARFPSHAILAEELGHEGPALARDGYCWVLDPIDGTTNYAHRLPIFCASLAVEYGGQPVVGAVFDPTRQELFFAERGAGAFLNGRPIHVSPTSLVLDSLLCTGFPYTVHQDAADLLALFAAFMGRARAVRRLGSAAIDLCYVACGRLDGFWEHSLKPWDTAAAVLVVEEAGGVVTRLDGSPYDSRQADVLASNGRLHTEMAGIIAGCSPPETG